MLVDESGQLRVIVANGEELQSPGCCKSVLTTIQGITFCPNFYVLPLVGCDVVLGIHWLRGLGPITWDFTSLSMKFQWAEKWVQLQGIQFSPSSFTNEGDKSLISAISKGKGLLLQLMGSHLEAPQLTCCPEIDILLLQFDKVFQEPVGLPPPRSQDHRIVLKDGTNPISTRPDKYPRFQKAEIEKIVTKRLTTGVIRPMINPNFLACSMF